MNESHRNDPIQGEIVHEYDGILEADNQLPRWWLATFFGSIVFAGCYWFVYQSWSIAPLPRGEYALAMEAAAASGGEVTAELLGLIAADASRVASGERTFTANCAACHGTRGEGLIGPNLTDPNWLHGGASTDLYRVVSEGVPSAGMPSWGPVLGAREVQSVVAYLLSIRDTNVPGREPQGPVWVPGAAPSAAAAAPSEAAEASADEAAEAAPAEAAPDADALPSDDAPAAEN